mgnify:CR=1 FL=1
MSMAVKNWNYTSRNKSGQVVKGKLEAPSESAVLGKLQSMGLSPLTVEEGRAGTGLSMEINRSGFEKGVDLWFGVVPSTDPTTAPTDGQVTEGVLRWTEMLGLDLDGIGDRLVLTPAGGLAGASADWTRTARGRGRAAAANL